MLRNLQSQAHCTLCLEDLCSIETCFLIFLFLQIGRQSLHGESNQSMMPCFMPTKSISNLSTRLVKRSLSMTKRSMANLNKNIQNPLTFFESTLTALRQFHCGLILLNMSMFAAPYHIVSSHNYMEGECYAQFHLSHDSQESSSVDSNASFFGSLWHYEHMPCTCPFILLLFCLRVHWTPCLVLNLPFHNSKIPLLKTGYTYHMEIDSIHCTLLLKQNCLYMVILASINELRGGFSTLNRVPALNGGIANRKTDSFFYDTDSIHFR